MTVNFTAQTLKLFNKKYQEAVKQKKEIFIFEGVTYITNFAPFLIEYAESKLKKE